MILPEMQITDGMRKVASEMIRGYYLQNYERHRLTPKGLTIYYDSREDFRQAAFDANPYYSAYASKPSGRPGYDNEYIRFDDAQKQEA